uniref:Uncharacterized protein n=1 Tax=Aegilops tauschii subsp. strangulata TaxID=200361 RepID=A0A453ERW8_AEGTS
WFTCSENGHVKRRKTGDAGPNEMELEQEEHSLSLSQHSSPSQSEKDQEQNGAQMISGGLISSAMQPLVRLNANGSRRTSGGIKTDQFLRGIAPQQRHEMQFLTAEPKQQHRPSGPPLIGAEVHGTVDGAFDSGYLVTAVVSGQLFRGVLFAPGPGVTAPRPVMQHQILNSSAIPPQHQHARPLPQATGFVRPDYSHHARRGFPARVVKSEPERSGSDLHHVVLTLGGPGGGN